MFKNNCIRLRGRWLLYGVVFGALIFGCGTASAQVCFTNYSLSPSGTICGQSTTVTMSGSQSGVSYQLQGNSGGNIGSPITGTGAALSWTAVPVTGGGTYVVVASGGGFPCSATVVASTGIFGTPAPAGTVTASCSVVSSAHPVTLAFVPSGNPTGYTYQWFNGPPLSGATTQQLSVTAPGSFGNYFVLVEATVNGSICGSNSFQAPALTTTPFSPPTAPAGSTSLCQGTTSTAYTSSATTAPTSYTWSISPSTAGTMSGTSSTGTVSWASGFSGPAVVSVVANFCSGPSSPVSTTVTVSPAAGAPSAPAGGASVCQGTATGTYTSGASNATSYAWFISPSTAGTISGTSTTGTVSWSAGFSGAATIGVSSVGCSGTSAEVTTAVTVHGDVGAPSAPNGGTSLCQATNSTPTAYTSSASNATSYVWVISPASAGTISGTGTTGTVNWSAGFSGAATIGVSSVGCNGTSSEVTTPVTVAPTMGLPGTPAGVTVVSQGATGSGYTTSGAAGGAGYSWSLTPAAAGTIVIVGTPTSASVNWNSGFIGTATVNVTAFGCGPSQTSSLTVTVDPALSGGDILTGSQSIAPGTSPGQLLTSAASGGLCNGNYTYLWLSSTNASGPFAAVTTGSSPSGENYTPGNLTTTTYYEREVMCGTTATAYTNIISITVGGNPFSGNLNYIRARDITRPGISTVTSAGQLTAVGDVKQTTQYFDELGRPWQTVSQLASNMQGDMVDMHVYDPVGNESTKFLPYASTTSDGNFKSNAAGDQNTFYASLYPSEGFYYQETNYEASPLARPLANYGAGLNYVGSGRGIQTQYEANTAADAVQEWFVTNSGTPGVFGSYSTTTTYPAGSLYKFITTDEQGHQSVEFKDMLGRVVLKKVQLSAAADNGSGSGYTGWLCTYYIYDDLNNLRCVIQPDGVNLLIANGWNITALSNVILNEQCFRYEYDQRNRMTTKQTPGALAVYMVYDNLDRLVMTQDANQRNSQQWLVTLYESTLDRPVETGLYTTASTFSSLLSAAAAAVSYPFAVGSAPSSGWELLTVTHYDDYSSIPTGLSGTLNTTAVNMTNFYTSTTSPQYAMPLTQSTPSSTVSTKGLVTWTQSEALDGTHTIYISTANIYDSRARLIQRQSLNYSGGLDIATTQYSFTDKPLILDQLNQKVSSGNPTQKYEVATRNSYDALERVTEVDKMVMASVVTSPAWEVISTTTSYDALGRLTTKTIGNSPASTPAAYAPLESQAYDYNVRNWLLGVNRNYINSSSPTNFFGFELGYDNSNTIVPATTYANVQYNGNIGGTVWKNGGDGVVRKYDYTYDAASRLMAADFNDYFGTSFNKSDGLDFSVSGIGYDANGNLLFMNQKGWNGATSTLIDELVYNYIPNTNRLQNVQDAMSSATTVLGDFRYSQAYTSVLAGPKPVTAVDYGYDGNGNLTSDKNKDITSIVYNYLNLQQTVNVSGATAHGTISYLYDATGEKLAKTVTETGATVSGVSTTIITTDNYVEGFVYETKTYTATSLASQQYTDKLQYFMHEEGRVRALFTNTASPNTLTGFAFDYFLKDHLGNTRSVITEEAETDAYPTLTFDGTGTTVTNQNAVWDNASGQSINVQSNQVSPLPVGFNATANGTYCGSVTKAQGAIGAAKLLKVMARDVLRVSVQVTYSSATVSNTSANGLNTLASSLAAMMLGSGQVSSFAESQASTIASGMSTVSNVQSFFLPETASTGTTGPPEAYLHVLLFNDQFVFDNVNSVVMPVNTTALNATQTLTVPNLVIPKSGYAYIYFSNESNTTVYFDNFMLTDVRGAILEMNAYYPFGLAMAGISDKAVKASYTENKYRYNKKELQHQEFSDGSGLEEYDFGARMQDPQLGVWHNADPMAETNRRWSPYVYGVDNPIRFIDPDGMDGEDVVGADGLTTAQWLETSRPNADPNLASEYRNQNRDKERKERQDKIDAQKVIASFYQKSGTVTDRATGQSRTYTPQWAVVTTVRVKVISDKSADGLQIIQIFHAYAKAPLPNTPDYDKTIVDNKDGKGNEASVGTPYYNSADDMKDVNYANATWDEKTNTGEISLFDAPTEAGHLDKTTIETYFVLKNYNNTKQDLVVAEVSWGFTMDSKGNVNGIKNPTFQVTNKFTPAAAKIVSSAYPNYSFTP